MIDPSGKASLTDSVFAGNILGSLVNMARAVPSAVLAFSATDLALGSRRHSYEYFNRICDIGDANCTREKVYEALKYYPAPIASWGGLGRPVVESGEQLELIMFSPVWTTANGVDAIHNETLKGHIFYHGIVDRSVVRRGNAYYIRSYGEGAGPIAAMNVMAAAGTWWAMDVQIQAFVRNGGL
jgi:hypothetical protein